MGADTAGGCCAVCMSPGEVESVHLSYGVVVQLCATHGARRYLTSDGGRVFVRRLTQAWQAHGVLTKTRVRALGAHVRRVREALVGRELPGSHAWAPERQECEQRFAAGEPIAQVIDDIRDPSRWHGRKPPTVRTIRRWYADGRWLAPKRKHPVRRLIEKRAMDALYVAMAIGGAYAWEDWIARHGQTLSPARQRLQHDLQRE